MRWWLLIVCGACGRIGFEDSASLQTLDDAGLPDGVAPDEDAITDPDALPDSCVAPGGGSTFPGGQPCVDWNANVNAVNAGVGEAGGTLSVTPNPNSPGAQGGCTKTGVAFGPGGAIVEIGGVVAGGNSITAIQLGGGATALAMLVQGGALLAQDSSGTRGMIAYDAQLKRFWRIRPRDSSIVFEYGDGTQWTQLATSPQVPQPSYQVQLIAGTISGVTDPGTARFESVNLCP